LLIDLIFKRKRGNFLLKKTTNKGIKAPRAYLPRRQASLLAGLEMLPADRSADARCILCVRKKLIIFKEKGNI